MKRSAESGRGSDDTALLVILGAVLWFPISFAVATAMHAVLFAKLTSWPAWMQILHPLERSSPRPSYWCYQCTRQRGHRPKKLSQVVFKSCKALKSLYLVKKVGFRYWQAGIAGTAAFDSLERIAGITSVVRWLRNAHVAKHLGVEKPTQKLRSFFLRWSIKFSVEYYEAKERQAASYQPSDH